jgi:hypothetical protein
MNRHLVVELVHVDHRLRGGHDIGLETAILHKLLLHLPLKFLSLLLSQIGLMRQSLR